MTRNQELDAKQIFHHILLTSKHYQVSLERLAQEMAAGRHDPRDLTMTGLFQQSVYYERYRHVSWKENIDFSAYDTSLERIERRWRELDFDARRDALLAQLGPEETQRRLLEEVTFLVKAYCSTVNVIHHTWDEMAAEEYEEFQQDDEFSDLETFTLRGSIHELLPLLVEGEAKSALERDLTQADATLRRYGAEIFGPLLRMGSIQQQREARFEPREHWWWYVDEISAG